MEHIEKYCQWSEEELNQRIFSLYDQIQKTTLQNLQVAQKNCQLEVQIKTIDDVLETIDVRNSDRSFMTKRSQVSIENKYENLLEDHLRLADRVNQMEEIIAGGDRKRGGAARSLKTSLGKTPSVQYVPVHTHRKTASKLENRYRQSQNTSRYGETHQKSKFK